MMRETVKATRVTRSLKAGALALAFAGLIVSVSAISAEAQTRFPPTDVGGSFPDRVESIYQNQVVMPGQVPMPGYEARFTTRGYSNEYAPHSSWGVMNHD